MLDLTAGKLHNNRATLQKLQVLVFNGVGGFFDGVELDITEPAEIITLINRTSLDTALAVPRWHPDDTVSYQGLTLYSVPDCHAQSSTLARCRMLRNVSANPRPQCHRKCSQHTRSPKAGCCRILLADGSADLGTGIVSGASVALHRFLLARLGFPVPAGLLAPPVVQISDFLVARGVPRHLW